MILQTSIFSPRLEDNLLLIGVVLFFIMLNILGWGKDGVMYLQTQYMHETRNARSFVDNGTSAFNPMRPILQSQLFIFSGLCIYYTLAQSFPLSAMGAGSSWLPAVISIGCPVVWYVFQLASFNWANYLFGDDDRIHILNRLYRAIHLLASPCTLVIFVLLMTGQLSGFGALFLLSSVFILCQILFIFYGFKIFLNGIGSLCFIISYLCALEIAPLVIIWQKLNP